MIFNFSFLFIDVRCFVAVDVDESLKDRIKALQKQLRGDVKLVEPENLHFTLKFLGEASDEILAEVSNHLKTVASGFGPFDARIHGTGVFPDINYIRVVWLGCSQLLPLQQVVEEVLAPMFKKEKPIPHLTIARVRSAKGMQDVKDFVDKNKDADIGTMCVNRIKLKKSTLSLQGPIYEDIEIFTLG